MNASLSHTAAREYFPALIDQELDPAAEAKVRGHLVECPPCRQGFLKYERAVEKVRGLQREKAPDALATMILHRTRKRRHGLRAIVRAHENYRMPYEIILPILLAAVIAALMVMLIT
ncbi:MAG: zf-HC2 domain-containing protein [Myxococcota bacterium]|nr:zf-HC2 domain-containing protein [Myxococcota bacterium]